MDLRVRRGAVAKAVFEYGSGRRDANERRARYLAGVRAEGRRLLRSAGRFRIASPTRTVPVATTLAFTPRRRSSRPTGELTNFSAS